jgi:hypothetical protein
MMLHGIVKHALGQTVDVIDRKIGLYRIQSAGRGGGSEFMSHLHPLYATRCPKQKRKMFKTQGFTCEVANAFPELKHILQTRRFQTLMRREFDTLAIRILLVDPGLASPVKPASGQRLPAVLGFFVKPVPNSF